MEIPAVACASAAPNAANRSLDIGILQAALRSEELVSGAERERHARPFSLRLPRRPSAPQKNTIRSANGAGIEEHVMVHRTDIAGGSTGQASPDNDRMCGPALSRALLETQSFARTSGRFSLTRREVLPSCHDGSPAGPRHLSRTPDPMRH
jgi:hypothetical protein